MSFKEWLKPKPIPWRQTLNALILMCLCIFMGFITGFYAGTGMLPTLTENKSITPPNITKASIIDVQNTLTEIDFPEYAEGYNCVDFAWQATRALAWAGQPSAIVAVQFETGPNHALLLVATTDEGWVFIEPQAEIITRPTIGGLYDGRRIVTMKVLVMRWVDYQEWQKAPVFEEIENE